MNSQTNQIPDAWDDEWENQVDAHNLESSETSAQPEAAKKVSARAIKAQKRAQHAEFNRQLWAEAETPQTFHFLESRPSAPVKSDYKPAVKVLTRKPQNSSGTTSSYGVDSTTAAGMQRLVILSSRPPSSSTTTISAADRKTILFNNQGNDMSDEERKRQTQLTVEERQAKTQREREEKQRKYEEVRERLFGTSTPGSGTSSPGSTTPPRQQQQSGEGKWKGGKNRSGGGNKNNNTNNRERRENSAASSRSRQLFDPTYSPKPNSSYVQRKERQQMSTERDDEGYKPQSPQMQPQLQAQAPIRSPRGPDGSGRGGFGFSNRGARG